MFFFFFQAEDGIRDADVTGVQTCALPIWLRVTVLSFGFKYGLPPDADFVLDARFLPNPFWEPDLRDLTGMDEPVSHFVLNQRGAATFVETYARLINATAPGFEREGKRYLTV